MPFQKVNGTDYYYELHGKGDPLVLISGYSRDSTLWAPVLEALSENYQVLIFDNRAVGQTKDKDEPLKLEALAKDTIDLAEAVQLKKPHIVGQSMGGTIAQIIGAEYGNRVNKIVLLVTVKKWRKAVLFSSRVLIDMRKEELPFDKIFNLLLGLVHGERILSDPKKIEFLYNAITNNPYPQTLKNYQRQFALLEEFDGTKLKISNPVHVISGNEDILALPSEGKELADYFGGSFALLDGAHELIFENRDVLANEIHQFLNK